MTYLRQIAERHGRDRWRDAAFIGIALLLTALAIGATTSKGVGAPPTHSWSITIVDPATQAQLR